MTSRPSKIDSELAVFHIDARYDTEVAIVDLPVVIDVSAAGIVFAEQVLDQLPSRAFPT
jgi:hypothetical protein